MSSDCHKIGIHLPLELCSLTCVGNAFPQKAKPRTINQRILWTSSQSDTLRDLIHLFITQIFKVLLPVLSLVHQKASPSRAVSSALQSTTDSSWKSLGGLLWKANPIAISNSFCIALPCSLLQNTFAWIVCCLKKISTPSTWKICSSLAVMSP